jgi:DNA-binding transcriptional ArsR family regulator
VDDDWTPLPDAPPIAEELLLDLDGIAEATHPIRSSILFRLRHPRSAAELAEEMRVPVTRLYHHLNLLESMGLISVVATRRSGAKTERRYRNVAVGFRLDPEVVRTADPVEFGHALSAMFDIAKYELLHEIDSGAIDPLQFRGLATIGLNELTLTDAQRAEFVERVKALLDDYIDLEERHPHPDGVEVHRFRVLVAGFPVTS